MAMFPSREDFAMDYSVIAKQDIDDLYIPLRPLVECVSTFGIPGYTDYFLRNALKSMPYNKTYGIVVLHETNTFDLITPGIAEMDIPIFLGIEDNTCAYRGAAICIGLPKRIVDAILKAPEDMHDIDRDPIRALFDKYPDAESAIAFGEKRMKFAIYVTLRSVLNESIYKKI